MPCATPQPAPSSPSSPPPPPVVAGIDLGTCNSAIAIVRDGVPTLVPDPDTGGPTTPSWVAVDPASLAWRVGSAALKAAPANPANTFPMPKRLLGRKFRGLSPADLGGGAAVVEAFDGGAEWWCPARGEALPPEGVAGVLIAHLLSRATAVPPSSSSSSSSSCRPVTAAVITVPARYGPAQLKATAAAGKAAGLGSVRLVPEPVAAAVAYGIGTGAGGVAEGGGAGIVEDATVLVIDVGGGTTDVAVVDAFEGMLEVLASAGDDHLGGGDWDASVAAWLAAQHPVAALLAGAAAAAAGDEPGVKAAAVGVARMLGRAAGRVQAAAGSAGRGGGGGRGSTATTSRGVWASEDEEGEDLPSTSISPVSGIGGAAALRLRGAAEAAKVALTAAEDTAVELHLVPGSPVARVALSRARFESLTAPLVGRVVDLVKKAAAEAGVELGPSAAPDPAAPYAPPPRRVSHAILVGGGSCVSVVRAAVAAVVGFEPVASIDPEACVALGAAAMAAALAGDVAGGGGFELADGPYAPHLHGRATGFD